MPADVLQTQGLNDENPANPKADEAQFRPRGWDNERMQFRERLKELGYENYSAYLRSSHWRKLRRQYRQERDWACRCGAAERLELHHQTYARLGAEELDDLTPLCQGCHAVLHDLDRTHRAGLDAAALFSEERAVEYAQQRPDLYERETFDVREHNLAVRAAAKGRERREFALDPEVVAKYGRYMAKQKAKAAAQHKHVDKQLAKAERRDARRLTARRAERP